MRLDTARNRATPEGVTLSLRVAGAPVRLLAWAVDLFVIAAILLAVQITLAILGDFGVGLILILSFAVLWFYGVVFELTNDGMTPGKKAMGLQVVHDDGTPVAATASLLRNFLRFADFLPFAWGAGLVSLLVTADCQRLGDLAAGTLVVYRDDDRPPGELAPGVPVAPPVALSRAEQRALVDFAARLPAWSPERARELADTARPLTRTGGDAGVERLVGMAHHVLGRRLPGAGG